MPKVTATDGTRIFYKDWGTGRPVVFRDLPKIDVPTLVLHGDDDQIVPIDASGRLTAQIVEGAELKVYPGVPHGLFATHADRLNADLLDFVKT